MRIRWIGVAAAALVLAVSAGCGLDSGSTAEPETKPQATAPENPAPQATPAAEEEQPADTESPRLPPRVPQSSPPTRCHSWPRCDEPAPEEEPAEAKPVTFSEAVEYADGLKIEVTGSRSAKISEWADGAAPGGDMTIFTIRITNGGKTSFDAYLVRAIVTYGEAGEEAADVLDSENDTDVGFTGKILPGKAMSQDLGYAIPAAELGDVTMQVAPDLDREVAIFSGPVTAK